jgi:hypothetical protein
MMAAACRRARATHLAKRSAQMISMISVVTWWPRRDAVLSCLSPPSLFRHHGILYTLIRPAPPAAPPPAAAVCLGINPIVTLEKQL